MITLYSGTPGSGKSLHCARTIKNWSRLGYPVIGNFPVDLSMHKRADFTYCPNDKMSPKFLIDYSRQRFGSKTPKEGSILLVIDECQLIFNAREWQQKRMAKWISFFTQHRKLGYDIILIAQFDRMIDRQIRSLIEYEYIHRKMSNFGWQGKLMSLFFGGKTFIAVKMWYPLNEKIGSEVFHARKSLYRIYDSYATFDGDQTAANAEPAQEETAPELPDPPKKKRWILRIPKLRKRQRKEKPEKQRKRPRIISGDYFRPYNGTTLVSGSGKFLRPGGRSETGWRKEPVNSQEH